MVAISSMPTFSTRCPLPRTPVNRPEATLSRWTFRVLYRPLEGVVYLLPSVLPHRVVRASCELLVLCNALDLAVVLDVRLDRGGMRLSSSPAMNSKGRAASFLKST